MRHHILAAGAFVALLAAPLAAQAQSGAAAGATTGAVGGAIVGGLSDQQRPEFRSYVVERRVPSYHYTEQVRVGARLPERGVTYYEVPAQYGVRDYRYTVVNERPVLVDPRTHTIVQVIE